jgi:hypothetical protein
MVWSPLDSTQGWPSGRFADLMATSNHLNSFFFFFCHDLDHLFKINKKKKKNCIQCNPRVHPWQKCLANSNITVSKIRDNTLNMLADLNFNSTFTWVMLHSHFLEIVDLLLVSLWGHSIMIWHSVFNNNNNNKNYNLISLLYFIKKNIVMSV